METSQELINKVKELWHQIHGERDTIFYWADDTETEYHYDENTNTIVAFKDIEFSVHITKNINDINKLYIIDLIVDLQWNIINYYRKKYYHELWYE